MKYKVKHKDRFKTFLIADKMFKIFSNRTINLT